MQTESPTAAIQEQFAHTFGPGGRIRIVRAPGRVNLIGEHTDYNDGFVFPMAIEPEVRLVCRGRADGRIRLASTAFPGQTVEFSVQEKIQRGEPAWANYCRGVAAGLIAAGIPLTGMDGLICNSLPPGGGLSSSAALEVATAIALLTLAGLEMEPKRLSLICQKAEHEFAGVPCGIMDQTIVLSARSGQATLLDCRDLSQQFVVIDDRELRVVIINSMVRHELSGGEYAKRRGQCEQAVKFFHRSNPAVKALRDVTIQQVHAAEGKLEEIAFRRCRHVVSENQRTVQAASDLGARRYESVGELMLQSHRSLRDDYQVSCAELDFLVEEAMKVKGVYGARMTGGGFGGCIVALTQPRAVEALAGHVGRAYADRFGVPPTVLATAAAAAADVLE